jgi:hypothetical protein
MNGQIMNKIVTPLIFVAGSMTVLSAHGADQTLSATDIVSQCYYKNAGEDQRAQLSITLKDKSGSEKKNIYSRYWKDYGGKDDIADKMLLITEFPPDAEGSKFLRWAYTRKSGRNADQWIYLPVLKKVRRVSVRDEGDSFLGSDLTYADISARAIDEDEHRLLKTEDQNGGQHYVIESIPRESNPLYSRRVLWFSNPNDMNECVNVKIEYYDKNNDLLKEQTLKWQRVDGAWVWDQVQVRNVRNEHMSVFEVSDVKVNTGIDDPVFSERNLLRQRAQ